MDFYATTGIVLGVLGLKWLVDVPRDVRLHDRKVRNRNEDLGNWVDDVDGDLTAELRKIGVRHTSRTSTTPWPLYLRKYERQQAKDEVVKRLGDQKRDAERYRDEILTLEQVPHRLWRRLRWAGPLPELTALSDKTDVLDRWRTPVTDEEVESAERLSNSIRKLAHKQVAKRTTPTGPFPPSGQS